MFLLGLPKQTREKLSKCWSWRQPSVEVKTFELPESQGCLRSPVPCHKRCKEERPEETKYYMKNGKVQASVGDSWAWDCELLLTRKLRTADCIQKVRPSNSGCYDGVQRRDDSKISLHRSDRRSHRESGILLPYTTGNLLCNWSAVGAEKIEALIKALGRLWQPREGASPPPQVFFDLGCGDGRVVHQICRAFPDCRGVGVDLNPGLVENARARAAKLGLSLCAFIVQDMADVDLSEAGAVFLYLPKPNLTYVASKILPNANLQSGAGLFCAEDPLPPRGGSYVSVNRHTEGARLYCYEWRVAAGSRGNDGSRCSKVNQISKPQSRVMPEVMTSQ